MNNRFILLIIICINFTVRFTDNCLSYSLKWVVDQAEGKCIQFHLHQPACCSQRHPPAVKPPCYRHVSITAATKPQPASQSCKQDRRQEALQGPFSFPRLRDCLDFRLYHGFPSSRAGSPS